MCSFPEQISGSWNKGFVNLFFRTRTHVGWRPQRAGISSRTLEGLNGPCSDSAPLRQVVQPGGAQPQAGCAGASYRAGPEPGKPCAVLHHVLAGWGPAAFQPRAGQLPGLALSQAAEIWPSRFEERRMWLEEVMGRRLSEPWRDPPLKVFCCSQGHLRGTRPCSPA